MSRFEGQVLGTDTSTTLITSTSSSNRSLPGGRTAVRISSAPPQPRAVASSSPGAPAARQDGRACEAAYKHLEQFSQWWVKSTPGAAPAAQLPRRHPFVSLCRASRAQVQRCMHGAYLAANEQHCAEQLKRLGTPKKDRIDALFLE